MADDQDLYERVWYAERDGKIDLGVDLKALNKPESPVFSRSDHLLPWLALICVTIVGWQLGGWVAGLAAAASMVILIATTINLAVMDRLRKRALKYALSGRAAFDELWGMGGLSLRVKDEPQSEVCGPVDDWRGFARARLKKTKAEREG